MKLRYSILILFLFLSLFTNGQHCDFIKLFPFQNYAYLTTTQDAYKNIFVAGAYTDAIQIDIQTMVATTNFRQPFLAKLDSMGNLLWYKIISADSNAGIEKIALDAEGNIVGIGYFDKHLYLGNDIFTSKGKSDFFISKFDSLGNYVWGKAGGSKQYDMKNVITASACDLHIQDNQIFFASFFNGSSNINDTFFLDNYMAVSNGKDDVFLCNMDKWGIVKYLKSYGGYSFDAPRSMEVSTNKEVFIFGQAYHKVYFETDTIVSNSGPLAYVAKFDSLGNYVWSKYGGYIFTGGNGDFYPISNIFLDSLENLYFSCFFYGAKFQFDGVIFNQPFTSTEQGCILAKYDKHGNKQWIKKSMDNLVTSIQGLSSNHLLFMGYSYIPMVADWGSGIGEFAEDRNLFLYATDSVGNQLNYKYYGSSNIGAKQSATLLNGQILFSGPVYGDTLAYSNQMVEVSSNSFYIMRFQADYPTSITETPNSIVYNIYPNPTNSSINIQSPQPLLVKVYNLLGEILFQSQALNKSITIQTSNWSKGIYIVELNIGTSFQYKKIAVQ